MAITKPSKYLSILIAIILLLTTFHIQNASAAARIAAPPEEAPSNSPYLYFKEGEHATGFENGAGVNTDRDHSGEGFGALGSQNGSKIVYEDIIAPHDGNYKFAFNYIAGPATGWSADRSIHIYVNGELEKTITFPGTGSWDNWQYFITDIELIGGYNQLAIATNGTNNAICVDYFYYWESNLIDIDGIRFKTASIDLMVGQSTNAVVQGLRDGEVVADLNKGVEYSSSNESVANINEGTITGHKIGSATITAKYGELTADAVVNVTVGSALEPEKPHPNALIYQAEDAALSGGACRASNHTGYTGTGFVACYDNSGTAKTTFTVDVPAAGEYFVSLRYSAGDVSGWPKNRTIGFTINGGTTIPIIFEGTDSTWNTWEENIQKVTLNAGANTIAYSALTKNDNSDVINLDKLSVWAFNPEPVVDAITFDKAIYVVSETSSLDTMVYAVNSNGVEVGVQTDVTYSSGNESIATINESGQITGMKAGTAIITASSSGMNASATVEVRPNPTVKIDYNNTMGPVNPSRFGHILTPNYDVADGRITLLGPVLNRETIPAQNFQAIHDLSSQYYQFEDSILQRVLETYNRSEAVGMKWYFLLGMNPSWATASGGPMDTTNHSLGHLKTPEQDAHFKQYVKDVLQYLKDNGATPDFANLTNEYWTGLKPTYKGAWEAVREVYPEFIPTTGPSAVGYNGIPDFYIPFASESQITVEGPSWHEFWTSNTYASLNQLRNWRNNIANLQAQYPEANGKYIIWEENNAGSTHPGDWTRSMANVIRTGVDYNIKGTLMPNNSNGMSDLLLTNQLSQNRAIRTTTWWVYYMFTQLSGQYVEVSTDSTQDFTAAASIDKNEAKIIFAKNAADGAVNLDLKNQPFSGQDIIVDLYKITNSENQGLDYQYSLNFDNTEDELYITVSGVAANEPWLAIIKKATAPPSFFFPKTPDDGEVAGVTPTLTWSTSQGAANYTVAVSKNKDLSTPVVNQSGIQGTSFKITTPLEADTRYYWRVTAVNEHGRTSVSHDTMYSFLVKDNTNVPSQFGPHLPTLNAPSEPVRPFLTWSRAYNATSYRVVVSENSDLSNPVIDQGGITATRGSHFGQNSQVYYQPVTALKWDTTYYWTAYAINEHGERPMNGPLRYFTTRAESNKPGAFNLLAPANGENDVSARVVFSWEPSKNAFFYKLEVSPNADMSNPVIVRDRMIYHKYTTEQNVLLPDTTYYWRVTALTKDLQHITESNNGILSFTTEKVPSSPLLYAERADGETVKLWFHTSKEATSYKIKYGTSPGNYTYTISDVASTPYEVNGLPNGTYYFAVVAVNEHGDSSIWNERTVEVTNSDIVPVVGPLLRLDSNPLTSPGSTVAITFGGDWSHDVIAQDITITYDSDKLEFISADSLNDETFSIVGIDDTKAGTIRLLGVHLGEGQNDPNGYLLQLKLSVIADAANGSTAITAIATVADHSGMETEYSGRSVSITINDEFVDKSVLEQLIEQARQTHDTAVEGYRIGHYPVGSKAVLQVEIESATQVLLDEEATAVMVAQAEGRLRAALESFLNSIIRSVEGDSNGDGVLTVGDLAVIAAAYNMDNTHPDWDRVKHLDIVKDGKIDIADLVALAKRILNW